MIKYKTTGHIAPHPKIKAVKIDRETEKCIWVNGHRVAKISEWECFFDTWQDAHSHILGRTQELVESARFRFDKYKGLLVDIKEMKEDE